MGGASELNTPILREVQQIHEEFSHQIGSEQNIDKVPSFGGAGVNTSNSGAQPLLMHLSGMMAGEQTKFNTGIDNFGMRASRLSQDFISLSGMNCVPQN